jgi:hypothetical protein
MNTAKKQLLNQLMQRTLSNFVYNGLCNKANKYLVTDPDKWLYKIKNTFEIQTIETSHMHNDGIGFDRTFEFNFFYNKKGKFKFAIIDENIHHNYKFDYDGKCISQGKIEKRKHLLTKGLDLRTIADVCVPEFSKSVSERKTSKNAATTV